MYGHMTIHYKKCGIFRRTKSLGDVGKCVRKESFDTQMIVGSRLKEMRRKRYSHRREIQCREINRTHTASEVCLLFMKFFFNAIELVLPPHLLQEMKNIEKIGLIV